MNPFIGRKHELTRLRDVERYEHACLVVVTGRRRIGKSRLIQEFAKGKRFLSFTGKTPTEVPTAQGQRDIFAKQLADQFNTQPQTHESWFDVLYNLSSHLTNEQTVILFDEISWMGTGASDFVADLKIWWDQKLQVFPNLTLVFCGSMSTWIEKNIINSTSFFGRITLHLELEQLSLPEDAALIRETGFKASPYDILKILAVTGGVPWYLEKISSHYTADDNIKHLCFEKNGILTRDFDRIFHDLFNGHSSHYKKIVWLLADGMKNLDEIGSKLDNVDGATLNEIMQDLVIAGFVSRHYSWTLKTEKLNQQYLYRLSDNYLRFYIKYIEPNLDKISANAYQELSLQNLPNWDSIMGLQVENLLLNNRSLLVKVLDLYSSDIVADNPYIQRTSTGQRGCQIDYLIQTLSKSLFVCEFKFKRQELGLEIIESMQEKISRFDVPHGFGIVPVLFHFGGVKTSVALKHYFYRIIDISDFLQMPV